MEALGGKYDDCRITELDGAEIIPLVVNFD